jgi:hypothetical protein
MSYSLPVNKKVVFTAPPAQQDETPLANTAGINAPNWTISDPSLASLAPSSLGTCGVTPGGKVGSAILTASSANSSGQGPNPLIGTIQIDFIGPAPDHLVITPGAQQPNP